ncbi:MAG: methylated-DNA--[protein]-cysteine S-methyltransferase [Minwuia sp.]|nr:methylated-DNA--[protein]-cysteine S-methyltransferase [Minwuia sp.]
MKNIALSYCYLETPIGRLLLAGDDLSLHFLSFPGGHKAFGPQPAWVRSDAPFVEATAQLRAYFARETDTFDLPLTLHGTAFQKRVWTLLQAIPFGQTTTYGALARQLDAPRSSRAVGTANGANPLPIIIPCHRVVGSNGALTGFGGGLETKQFLLRHEGATGFKSG